MNQTTSFDDLAAQLCAFISRARDSESEFNHLAAALFSSQVQSVPIYRQFCEKRGVLAVSGWRKIPALPTTAFKEFDVTSLTPHERTRVFHSSGTTQHQPGRHFHNAASLAIYEASLLPWFRRHFLNPDSKPQALDWIILTPPLSLHSSLAHMFETIRREFGNATFTGRTDSHGAWTLDIDETILALTRAQAGTKPVALLGTAFSFVHLLDHCQSNRMRLHLPAGSRVMETGGYKGRSRVVSKIELRRMITHTFAIPETHILSEYGMSELSSQAYDRVIPNPGGVFHFPPWARAQIISPENGREVAEGETGMIRVFDLANVRSVMAIQTEDLGVRRGDGFELIGRAPMAEPRGCSLLALDS